MNQKLLTMKVPDDKLADEMMRTADDLAEQTRSIAATIHRRGSEIGHTTHHLLRTALDAGANVRWLRALIKEVGRRNDRIDAGFGTLPTRTTPEGAARSATPDTPNAK